MTLGCEKNTVDSEVLMGGLRHNGVRLVNDPAHSDIIILNTCGFIESAKRESINSILEAVELKKSGSVKEVYVAGCLSERYRAELEAEITGVDGYFGTEDFERIIKSVVPEAEMKTGADLRYELLGEQLTAVEIASKYGKTVKAIRRRVERGLRGEQLIAPSRRGVRA